MADYNGTDEDDIIDASELDRYGNIYPGKGNDTITNAKSGQTIVSSPGEDTISGSNFDYAFWNATQAVTINLKEGWSEDGFGTRDTVSGVTQFTESDLVIHFMEQIIMKSFSLMGEIIYLNGWW